MPNGSAFACVVQLWGCSFFFERETQGPGVILEKCEGKGLKVKEQMPCLQKHIYTNTPEPKRKLISEQPLPPYTIQTKLHSKIGTV